MSSRSNNNCDSIQIIANQRGAIELLLHQSIMEMTPNNFDESLGYLQSTMPLVREVRALNETPKLNLVSDENCG
jgi:hypothetical protein